MAQGTSTPFGEFMIKIGDGANPEVFAAPCGLTSKGFNQSASVQETTTPDCADDDAAVPVERTVDTLSKEISGSGVMVTESFDTWQSWYDSGAAKNVRVYPKGATGGYYEGAFVLTAFNMTAQRKQKVNVDLTMQSSGANVWHGP